MRIENRFTVSLPIEEAWGVLFDIEGIAPCMPGAVVDEVGEDGVAGRVKIKLGAIVTQFKGTVRFAEMDQEANRIVLHASGREMRGQGNATADVTVVLSPTDAGTEVSIDADLAITGKIVQYGRGVIVDVTTKLIRQFVDCLEDKLATEGRGGLGQAAAGGAGT
ncbi:MAG: SRPBCC family protein [Actinomycetota bacterium]|nr:SRPBCC family protein [Actinomycetota bacterium]